MSQTYTRRTILQSLLALTVPAEILAIASLADPGKRMARAVFRWRAAHRSKPIELTVADRLGTVWAGTLTGEWQEDWFNVAIPLSQEEPFANLSFDGLIQIEGWSVEWLTEDE